VRDVNTRLSEELKEGGRVGQIGRGEQQNGLLDHQVSWKSSKIEIKGLYYRMGIVRDRGRGRE
jgi:hypothetical protein